MGYDMYTKEQGEYFRANVWGMGMLRSAMARCGVQSGPVVERELELDLGTGERRTLQGDLYSCFCSNEGWLVTPEECSHIAECLQRDSDSLSSYFGVTIENNEFIRKEMELESDDRELIKEFAEYCRKAAGQGGFYVW